jgi:hypothetical protein
MLTPKQKTDSNHNTENNGLDEFLNVWLAFCSIVILIPSTCMLFISAIVGSLFVLIIDPYKAAIYLGVIIEGVKRLIKGCVIGVLNDKESKDGTL